MSRKRDRLELFWVMSDTLAGQDEQAKDRALLILRAFFRDQVRTKREVLVRSSRTERRKLALAVWGHLQDNGLLRPTGLARAVYVRGLVDGLAWFLAGPDLSQARQVYRHLTKRLYPTGPPSYAVLSRDNRRSASALTDLLR